MRVLLDVKLKMEGAFVEIRRANCAFQLATEPSRCLGKHLDFDTHPCLD